MTVRPRRARPALRLSARGAGVGLVGAALAAYGFVAALTPLLVLGLLLCVPVAVTAALLLPPLGARFTVSRTLRPLPAHVGDLVTVTTVVAPRRLTPWTADALHGLRLAEAVPVELHDDGPLHGHVEARYGDVRLEHVLRPAARGRWHLGPLEATRVGPLGLCRATSALGDAVPVAIRPRLLPMTASTALARAGISPVCAGADEPSDEDSSLRRYVPGDDLRRVHWKSVARHRELHVRVDEGASLTPATVVVDLPPARRAPHDPVLERVVAVGATLASHLLGTGHAVRLVAAGAAGPGGVHPRVEPTDGDARARVLDPTIDLAPVPAGPARTAARSTLLAEVVAGRRGAERLVVVLAAGRDADADELAAYGAAAPGSTSRTAVVVPTRPDAGRATVRALRAHGWRAVVLDDDDLDGAWQRLTEGRA